ncbi:MAG: hypothetical protein K2N17_03135 [Clostridia bacterium]|nr:hypothetical protein [Clostridia bacterium]
MKKIIRTLTIAVIAMVAVFACTFALACNGGDNKSDYNFTIVYEDGTAVNGQKDGINGGKVATQICLPDVDNVKGACVPLSTGPSIFPDKNGKLSLSQEKVNELFQSTTDVTVFIFHVMAVPGHKADCEVSVNGKGDYKVTVTKN